MNSASYSENENGKRAFAFGDANVRNVSYGKPPSGKEVTACHGSGRSRRKDEGKLWKESYVEFDKVAQQKEAAQEKICT
jgi:hypothetical protein